MKATDRDRNDVITYHLQSTRIPFDIDENNGEILLKSPGVDYESKKVYNFKVVAQDNGTPTNRRTKCDVTVTIGDVNDNAPSLVVAKLPGSNIEVDCNHHGNCTISMHESDSIEVMKSGIVQLNATDRDSDENGAPFTFKLATLTGKRWNINY